MPNKPKKENTNKILTVISTFLSSFNEFCQRKKIVNDLLMRAKQEEASKQQA